MRALALLLMMAVPASAAKYTLPQLLAKVRSEYPGVIAARESVGAADAQLSQARRLWWPTGLATFGFTLAPTVHCVDPDATKAQNDDVSFRESHCITTNVNTANVSNTGAFTLVNPALKLDLTLTQPIYTSGKIEAAIGAAHAGQDAARAQADAAREDATLNAVRAYWGLKWARAAAATLSDGHDRVKEWVGKIDKSLESGKNDYTEQDLLRLKISVDNIELALLDVKKAEVLALAAVRTLTVDAAADIDDDEIEVQEVVQKALGYYEDSARLHRPEARLLDAGKSAVHSLRKLKLAELLPDIGLVGTFSYSFVSNVDTPNNSFMNHPNSLGVGLYLAIRQPLDIAEKLAQLSQAKAEERAFDARREAALGGIALDIQRAFSDADTARKRHDVTAHGEKVARGWYNSVDQILQVGVADSKDLVDAARGYFEMRLAHLQAIMDLNISLAALRRAAGVE